MQNSVNIQGRLVSAPEMRQTQSGKDVASFRIACDRSFAGSDGKREADFFNCVAWGKSAEFVCRWFQKGSSILVTGRLSSRNYKDRDGNNRTAIEIVASDLNFCGSKGDNARSGGEGCNNEPPAPAYAEGANDDFAVVEDNGDLPF